MKITRTLLLPALTVMFGACAVLAGTGVSPAAPKRPKKSAVKPAFTAAQVAHGKMLAEAKGCNTCHGAEYMGKKGFSPSLHANGAPRHYNAKTFARLMDTGITDDGKIVKKPMPVYRMTTKNGTDVYAFLTTLK